MIKKVIKDLDSFEKTYETTINIIKRYDSLENFKERVEKLYVFIKKDDDKTKKVIDGVIEIVDEMLIDLENDCIDPDHIQLIRYRLKKIENNFKRGKTLSVNK